MKHQRTSLTCSYKYFKNKPTKHIMSNNTWFGHFSYIDNTVSTYSHAISLYGIRPTDFITSYYGCTILNNFCGKRNNEYFVAITVDSVAGKIIFWHGTVFDIVNAEYIIEKLHPNIKDMRYIQDSRYDDVKISFFKFSESEVYDYPPKIKTTKLSNYGPDIYIYTKK